MINVERFRRRAVKALEYCRQNGYNDRVLLLRDLSLHSGRRRLVVWDVVNDSILYAFVASHGSGSECSLRYSAYAATSNTPDSHLSSVGRALVAERYVGRYGVAYRLDGLDESNSALRERCVVLHGWKHTTSFPIWPMPTVGSWGCPVLSLRSMAILDEIIRNEEKVVLYAYK
jgi:hypothetical protein